VSHFRESSSAKLQVRQNPGDAFHRPASLHCITCVPLAGWGSIKASEWLTCERLPCSAAMCVEGSGVTSTVRDRFVLKRHDAIGAWVGGWWACNALGI
jgi:hypothetical protein